jgi:Uma2 family endonuclease
VGAMSAMERHDYLAVEQFLDMWDGKGRAELFGGIAYAMAGGWHDTTKSPSTQLLP